MVVFLYEVVFDHLEAYMELFSLQIDRLISRLFRVNLIGG